MEENVNYLQGRLGLDGRDTETSLIEYGIFQEQSDIRAHVSNKIIYVFKTKEGVIALRNNEFTKKYAYQPGYNDPTALGYLVPPKFINDIRELKYHSWDGWKLYSDNWNTTEKGKWAVNCIIKLLEIGRFPLWILAINNGNKQIDIKGTDIIVFANQRIQVKCDYPAIKTGNLYIQTHEKNPFKRY